MKINLINLPSPWLISDRDTIPNGILLIAAYLREQGKDVIVTDLAGLEEKDWIIPDADIYGISTTTPQYPHAIKVVKKLKDRQECIVVLGGFHPTVMPEETIKESLVDIVVVGEGEEAMLDICNGKRDKIIYSPLIKDINKLPSPAIDMIDTYEYLSIGTNAYVSGAKREAYIQTARGCPYNCSFCCQRKMWRGSVREYSVKHVMEEVDLNINKYNVEQIYFNDDTFILSEKRVRQICKEMIKRDVVWHCLSRVDRVSPEILDTMYKSGCRAVTFGIESGSNTMLSKMNKLVNTEQATEAVKMAKEAGLKVRCQMIVGFPGETDETIEETKKFVKRTVADTWGFHAFVPFPGCDVWDNPEKYGFKIDKSKLDFGDFHTIGRPNEWHAIINPQADKVRKWLSYLIKQASNKNIFKLDVKNEHN